MPVSSDSWQAVLTRYQDPVAPARRNVPAPGRPRAAARRPVLRPTSGAPRSTSEWNSVLSRYGAGAGGVEGGGAIGGFPTSPLFRKKEDDGFSVGGFLANVGGDIKDIALGLPGLVALGGKLAVSAPIGLYGSTIGQVAPGGDWARSFAGNTYKELGTSVYEGGKQIASNWGNVLTGNFKPLYEDPVFMGLDVAAVATGGSLAAVRGAQVLNRGARVGAAKNLASPKVVDRLGGVNLQSRVRPPTVKRAKKPAWADDVFGDQIDARQLLPDEGRPTPNRVPRADVARNQRGRTVREAWLRGALDDLPNVRSELESQLSRISKTEGLARSTGRYSPRRYRAPIQLNLGTTGVFDSGLLGSNVGAVQRRLEVQGIPLTQRPRARTAVGRAIQRPFIDRREAKLRSAAESGEFTRGTKRRLKRAVGRAERQFGQEVAADVLNRAGVRETRTKIQRISRDQEAALAFGLHISGVLAPNDPKTGKPRLVDGREVTPRELRDAYVAAARENFEEFKKFNDQNPFAWIENRDQLEAIAALPDEVLDLSGTSKRTRRLRDAVDAAYETDSKLRQFAPPELGRVNYRDVAGERRTLGQRATYGGAENVPDAGPGGRVVVPEVWDELKANLGTRKVTATGVFDKLEFAGRKGSEDTVGIVARDWLLTHHADRVSAEPRRTLELLAKGRLRDKKGGQASTSVRRDAELLLAAEAGTAKRVLASKTSRVALYRVVSADGSKSTRWHVGETPPFEVTGEGKAKRRSERTFDKVPPSLAAVLENAEGGKLQVVVVPRSSIEGRKNPRRQVREDGTVDEVAGAFLRDPDKFAELTPRQRRQAEALRRELGEKAADQVPDVGLRERPIGASRSRRTAEPEAPVAAADRPLESPIVRRLQLHRESTERRLVPPSKRKRWLREQLLSVIFRDFEFTDLKGNTRKLELDEKGDLDVSAILTKDKNGKRVFIVDVPPDLAEMVLYFDRLADMVQVGGGKFRKGKTTEKDLLDALAAAGFQRSRARLPEGSVSSNPRVRGMTPENRRAVRPNKRGGVTAQYTNRSREQWRLYDRWLGQGSLMIEESSWLTRARANGWQTPLRDTTRKVDEPEVQRGSLSDPGDWRAIEGPGPLKGDRVPRASKEAAFLASGARNPRLFFELGLSSSDLPSGTKKKIVKILTSGENRKNPNAQLAVELVRTGAVSWGSLSPKLLKRGDGDSVVLGIIGQAVEERLKGKLPLNVDGTVDWEALDKLLKDTSDPRNVALREALNAERLLSRVPTVDAVYVRDTAIGVRSRRKSDKQKRKQAVSGFGQMVPIVRTTGTLSARAAQQIGTQPVLRTWDEISRGLANQQFMGTLLERFAARTEFGQIAVLTEAAAKNLGDDWGFIPVSDFERAEARLLTGNDSSGFAPGSGTKIAADRVSDTVSSGERTLVYVFPKPVAEHVAWLFRNPSQWQIYYDSFLEAWRGGVLALAPRWFINNFVGNTVFYGMFTGFDLQAFRAAKNSRTGARDRLPYAIEGNTFSTQGTDRRRFNQSADPKETLGEANLEASSGLLSATDLGERSNRFSALYFRATDGAFRLNQRLEGRIRRAGYIHAATRLMRENGQLPSGLTGRLKRSQSDAELVDSIASMSKFEVQESLREMRQWFGDYSNLSDFERNVVRRVIPFYSWLRVINTWLFGLPFRSPLRAEALALATQIELHARGDVSYLPWWEQGRIDLPGGYKLRTSGSNPFASVVEPILAMGYENMGWNQRVVEGMRGLGGGISPPLSAVVGGLTGRNLFGDRDYTAPPDYGGAITPYGSEPQFYNSITGQYESRSVPPPIFEQILQMAPLVPQIRAIASFDKRPYDTAGTAEILGNRLLGIGDENQLYQPPPKGGGSGREKLPGLGPLLGYGGFPVYSADRTQEINYDWRRGLRAARANTSQQRLLKRQATARRKGGYATREPR